MSRRPDIDQKFIWLFEAAKRSLLIFDRMHARLWSDLRQMEPMILERQPIDELVQDALIAAVTLVDFAHRFAQLIDALPYVNKRAPHVRALGEQIAAVEEARHHLQHLRGDLGGTAPINYPILGAVGWVNGLDAFLVSFSQAGAEQFSPVFDRFEGRYVRQLEYSVRDKIVDIDGAHAAMHRVFDWIAASIQTTPEDFKQLKWASTFAGHFRVHRQTE
jgi:hypothetical protein